MDYHVRFKTHALSQQISLKGKAWALKRMELWSTATLALNHLVFTCYCINTLHVLLILSRKWTLFTDTHFFISSRLFGNLLLGIVICGVNGFTRYYLILGSTFAEIVGIFNWP